MKPKCVKAEEESGYSQCRIALLISLLSVLICAGCGPTKPTTTTTTTTPTPTPTPDIHILDGTDEPIVVKGGSLDINFNHDIFKDNGSGNVFVSSPPPTNPPTIANRKITEVVVYDDSKIDVLQTYEIGEGESVIIPYDGNKSIKIENVVIGGATQVQITLDGSLKPRALSKRMHFVPDAKNLTAITVNTKANTLAGCKDNSNSNLDPAQCSKLPNKFTIEIITHSP